MKRTLRAGMSSGLLALAVCAALHSPPSLAARDAQTILKETCQGCHTPVSYTHLTLPTSDLV